jgi:hypothetical protein
MNSRPDRGLSGLFYARLWQKVLEKFIFLCPNPQVNRDIIVNNDRCDNNNGVGG